MADNKALLQAFVAQQERSLQDLEARYAAEKSRLNGQIRAANMALARWDANTDALLASLEAAGIKVRP